ncbi:MAG: undecaprenyldiphospho-muramoylpentapeptide beta-N-acetylglucosaminyltransferase [Minisyncoccia bacterium]
MRIVLTGGGTGGHFYPVIAIAQAIRGITKRLKLISIELFYMSSNPYNEGVLFEQDINFIPVPAGKMRKYFSLLNITDTFKTGFGILKALFKIYSLFPDAVFGKGGYASVPALFAARVLGIPVMIHESDSVPGRANMWAGKFAKRIAVSYEEAAQYFPKDRVVFTGHPVREELRSPLTTGAKEYLKLEDVTPVILILGGSLGAQKINETILDALPELVKNYQVIHQTGKEHFQDVSLTADTLLTNSPYKNRYKPFEYLNTLSMRMCAGVADVVITRAGSTLFEIAWWGIPSIVIPITSSNGDHQIRNAYAYAETGAGIVLEEKNLKPHVLIEEVSRLIEDKVLAEKMRVSAKKFAHPDAAEKIAEELLRLAVTHGKVDKRLKKLQTERKLEKAALAQEEQMKKIAPKQAGAGVEFLSQDVIPDNVVMSDKTTEELLQEELSAQAAQQADQNSQQY